MHRRTIHRRIAALALITVFALTAAQPAAAADLGFLDRIASFWSAVIGGEPTGLWGTLAGWLDGTEKTTSSNSATSDRGMGIDPNGEPLTGETTDPMASGSH
ncbi:MAG TPA: hypothetical protein VGG03_02145 [Thermoanaerobaculia bacterium]|jgi:hypothetical protein